MTCCCRIELNIHFFHSLSKVSLKCILLKKKNIEFTLFQVKVTKFLYEVLCVHPLVMSNKFYYLALIQQCSTTNYFILMNEFNNSNQI